MTWPEATIVLDERVLRDLLETQFSSHANLALSRATEGFDNVLWRLGERYLVRLPRRVEAVPLMENEIRWMPELAPRLPGLVRTASVRRVWQAALDAPRFEGQPVWIHGDLHPSNLIVRSGSLAAVVDFGDLCAGDPATDLAGAWMFLSHELLGDFLDAYGEHDEGLIARSLGWAALFGTMFVSLGMEGRANYLDVGKRTLESVVRFVD